MDDRELNIDDEIEELEIIEESPDKISNGSSPSTNPLNSNSKSSNRKIVDETIDGVGSQLLQKAGVPESVANKAIKNNGGALSPSNTPMNKLIKNRSRNQVASSMNKFGSNKNDSDMLKKRLQRGQGQNLSKINASNRIQEEDLEKKSAKAGVQEQVASKALSTAAQAYGIPKPLADLAANKVAGPLLEMKKKKRKMMIISILVPIFVILIPIVLIASDEDFQDSNSKNKSSYLYGSGSEEDLYEYLKELGLCDDNESCASTDAAKFYKKLKEQLDSSANLTKQEADIFISKTIFYKRDKEEAYKKIDEIEYLANILKKNGKFSINNIDKYKEEFVSDTGYLVTYRNDLLEGNNTLKHREDIFNDIVNITIEAIKKYEKDTENNQKGYLVCSQITVTGDLAGTYDLEEYVAKVVTSENNWAPDGNLESMKAQAVTARTYALRHTNNCTIAIENSTKKQTMKADASDNAIAATQAVAGQVLVNSKGDYISTEYDAFCLKSSDDENYIIEQKSLAIPKSWADSQPIKSSWKTNVCGTDGDGGHGRGMSQWGANYLISTGYTYDQVLSYFYDNAIIKTLIPAFSGLEQTTTGFLKRTSRAMRDNEYFYGDGALNEGECAWYAVRRTNEILASIGSDIRVQSGGNGGDFCYSADYSKFNKVTDINDLKPGMVISWTGGSGHNYGHVAIIEDVYYNNAGSIISVDLSEGSNSSGTGFKTTYNGNFVDNNYIWSLPNSNYKQQVRQYNCEGSLYGSDGTGCQKFTNVPIENIKNRWGYKFVCAIDLLSGEE